MSNSYNTCEKCGEKLELVTKIKRGYVDYTCDVCGKQSKSYSHSCLKCSYDVCGKCMREKMKKYSESLSESEDNSPKCEDDISPKCGRCKNELIRISIFTQKCFCCDECGKDVKTCIYYNCSHCDYKLCHSCFHGMERKIRYMHKRKNPLCVCGNELKFATFNTRGCEFTCYECNRDCGKQVSYSCSNCGYDLCHTCFLREKYPTYKNKEKNKEHKKESENKSLAVKYASTQKEMKKHVIASSWIDEITKKIYWIVEKDGKKCVVSLGSRVGSVYVCDCGNEAKVKEDLCPHILRVLFELGINLDTKEKHLYSNRNLITKYFVSRYEKQLLSTFEEWWL